MSSPGESSEELSPFLCNISMNIKSVVEENGPTLERIRKALEELGCIHIIFWGLSGEGKPYEIEFTHNGTKQTFGPYYNV